MFDIGNLKFEKPLFLAPMEEITDLSYRKLLKELGADFVFTEFVNCEGLTRGDEKTAKKMILSDEERPAGIQIYGERFEAMVDAAKIAAEQNPDILDINAGCWVKKVAGRGAGAALMKEPAYLEKLAAAIVKAVHVPVTVKTRLGWDFNSINILEIAQRLENVGVAAITIHCRTKSQGHGGEVDWSWIKKIKEQITIPVILNGGILKPEDGVTAFETTPADGIMIARGAITNPWIFKQIKQLLNAEEIIEPSIDEKIETAIKHLKYSMRIKEEKKAIIEFRKYYSGYLRGLHKSSPVRNELMKVHTFDDVQNILFKYLKELKEYYNTKKAP